MTPAETSRERLTVTAPYDGSVIGDVAIASRATVEEKLADATTFHARGTRLKVAERIEVLGRAAAIMTDQSETLAIEAAREGGKPLIDSRIEVARAIDCLHVCVETLRSLRVAQ